VSALTTLEVEIAARAANAAVTAAFSGRRGHGSGGIGRRVLRPDELRAIVHGAVSLALEARAVAGPGPRCGHSACSQNYIDTGVARCVAGEAL
jgi:hypothetical protein